MASSARQDVRACDLASAHGSYHLRTVRVLVARPDASRQEPLPFLEEHPLIRDLSAYGQFVEDTLDKVHPIEQNDVKLLIGRLCLTNELGG